jgi:hypothetical protein
MPRSRSSDALTEGKMNDNDEPGDKRRINPRRREMKTTYVLSSSWTIEQFQILNAATHGRCNLYVHTYSNVSLENSPIIMVVVAA